MSASTPRRAKPKPDAMLQSIRVETEEWRVVPGFPGYEASSLGGIRRATATGRYPAGYVMKFKQDRHGYLKACLSFAGYVRHTQVHRIIAETFHGPCPSGRRQVAHWDGNRMNNAASNLRWVSAAENAADRDRHGRTAGIYPSGEGHPGAKLTNDQAKEIRRRRANGERGIDLAAEFGVSPPTISEIALGKAWVLA